MTTLHIFDEVGDYGVTAYAFKQDLDAIGWAPVDLRLNSPGGSAIEGLSIYHLLKQHPGRVTVTVDGLAASIASVIAMAADPGQLFIAPAGMMMIHEAWSVTAGPASEHRKQADLLDIMTGALASIYEERTGIHDHMWIEAMQAETWYASRPGGHEAVDAGLADAVLASAVAA